ncbi:hypothetical protein [Reinekea sp. G2M2-21]|uniref:hypothetical protein n=1 Tax=Reinekea sp. G2M2-21 TaxID=2788942 RepID=UPI0018AB77AB|nr:hypothetical protein [Reinekea sp. G2M2-21]
MKNILLIVTTLLSFSSLAKDSVPIMVGGNENLDACTAYILIKNGTELRVGPNEGYEVLMKIEKDLTGWSCSYSNEWSGVIFPLNGEYCGVSSPIPEEKAYSGPCLSGWVPSSQIELLAGG